VTYKQIEEAEAEVLGDINALCLRLAAVKEDVLRAEQDLCDKRTTFEEKQKELNLIRSQTVVNVSTFKIAKNNLRMAYRARQQVRDGVQAGRLYETSIKVAMSNKKVLLSEYQARLATFNNILEFRCVT
jgi:hypothetical protein